MKVCEAFLAKMWCLRPDGVLFLDPDGSGFITRGISLPVKDRDLLTPFLLQVPEWKLLDRSCAQPYVFLDLKIWSYHL